MLPSWKIKRELARISAQIVGLPRTIANLPSRFSEPSRRRAYDAAFPNNLRITDGAIAPGPRLAVFVIYQPRCVAASTRDTCRQLAAAGHALIVISNAPLSAQDLEFFQEMCWRVVERPNFGYDFGAYRDGIRFIREAGLTPDRLILMNDSFWCSLTPELLSRVDALDADLAGLVQDEKVQHDTKGGTPTHKIHIESYFCSITARLWSAEAFKAFWDAYPMTDHKPNTIKNGEIGFSRAMAGAGFKLAALTNRSNFMAAMSDATHEEQCNTLRYAAYDDHKFRTEADALLSRPADTGAWRADVLDHIRRWVNRRRFNAAYPLASANIFGTSFIKKSNEPIFGAARRAYLQAVEDGFIQNASPVVLSEIAETLADGALKAARNV